MSRAFPSAVATALQEQHVVLVTFAELHFRVGPFMYTTQLAHTLGAESIGLVLVTSERLVK